MGCLSTGSVQPNQTKPGSESIGVLKYLMLSLFINSKYGLENPGFGNCETSFSLNATYVLVTDSVQTDGGVKGD